MSHDMTEAIIGMPLEIATETDLARMQFHGRAQQLLREYNALFLLIHKVHSAKGRHHTQLAMCDLFDAVGLANERPATHERRRSDMKVTPDARGISAAPPDGFGKTTDPLYSQAVALVLDHNMGSISLVQRHLGTGYNRAADMLQQMELAGILTPVRGLGGREVIPQVDRKKPCDTEGGSHD